jgi:hypothetical protein
MTAVVAIVLVEDPASNRDHGQRHLRPADQAFALAGRRKCAFEGLGAARDAT